MTAPVRPSHSSQTNGTNPSSNPLKKPTLGGFPGSDYLYPVSGAIASTVSSFIAHVLNGVQLVVKMAAYILSYPFLTHYEARITSEMLSDIIKGIKNGTDLSKKFLDLETNLRVAIRNEGDVSSAKQIIEAFAEAEKDVFAKIAEKVIDVRTTVINQITLPPEAYILPEDYVLSRIQNGLISLTDFYYALDFYRMETATVEEQLRILKFYIELAEWYKAEVPHAQNLLLAFAKVNVVEFKELVACLAELNKAIKGTDSKSIEEVAKEWIENSSKFSATQVREALDLKAVKGFFSRLTDIDSFEKAHRFHEYLGKIFLPKKYGATELSHARRDFIARVFLERLSSEDPGLMKTLSMLMIKVDEKNKEEDKNSGLYEAASKDDKYEKPDFNATSHVLTWIKEERKFNRDVMFNAIQHLERNLLKEGVTNERQAPSFRFDIFDRGLARIRESDLETFIANFAEAECNEELGAAFVQALFNIDTAKASKDGVKRFFPTMNIETANPEDLLEAVLNVAKEVVKESDIVIQAFRGILREAVAYVQAAQFKADIESEDLNFSQKLNTFLLLSRFEFADPRFPKQMVEALSKTSKNDFANLAIFMAETCAATKSQARVKELDRLAKGHRTHPDMITQTRQQEHAKRGLIMNLLFESPAKLTFLERQRGKRMAYRTVFAANFDKVTDLDWLCKGMRSYLVRK